MGSNPIWHNHEECRGSMHEDVLSLHQNNLTNWSNHFVFSSGHWGTCLDLLTGPIVETENTCLQFTEPIGDTETYVEIYLLDL